VWTAIDPLESNRQQPATAASGPTTVTGPSTLSQPR
jgi:hypothetical protein